MTDTRMARVQPPADKVLNLQTVCDMTGYKPAEVALIAKTVAVGAPLAELAVFLHAARTLHLDPLLRQCYWIRRGNPPRGTLQVGIDGFRAIADSSGAYAGSEPPSFRGTVKVNDTLNAPEKCSVTVWKIVQGHKSAFTGEAFWKEFYPGQGADGAMWRKMPHRMLAKTAEAEALRKGFPALLSAVAMDQDAGEEPHTAVTETARRDYAGEYTRILGDDDDPQPAPAPAPDGETERAQAPQPAPQ